MNIPPSQNLRGIPLLASLLAHPSGDGTIADHLASLEGESFTFQMRERVRAESALDPLPSHSFHLSMHRANLRLLQTVEQRDGILGGQRQELASLFSGPGVYIGPEDKGISRGFGPYPASHVAMIRDELLAITRLEFPKATTLSVLGPQYEFGYSETPGVACAERDFFYGLDTQWPQELINQKLSWGVCLGLWDSAYYVSVHDDQPLSSRYEAVATALHNNMGDQAALLVSTLMMTSPDAHIFQRSFERCGWQAHRLGRYGADPLLLVKRPENRRAPNSNAVPKNATGGETPSGRASI